MSENVKFLRSKGYPLKIRGNGGYTAVLTDIQPLVGGDYEAIYRYPGGLCCHDLASIKRFYTVIER